MQKMTSEEIQKKGKEENDAILAKIIRNLKKIGPNNLTRPSPRMVAQTTRYTPHGNPIVQEYGIVDGKVVPTTKWNIDEYIQSGYDSTNIERILKTYQNTGDVSIFQGDGRIPLSGDLTDVPTNVYDLRNYTEKKLKDALASVTTTQKEPDNKPDGKEINTNE